MHLKSGQLSAWGGWNIKMKGVSDVRTRIIAMAHNLLAQQPPICGIASPGILFRYTIYIHWSETPLPGNATLAAFCDMSCWPSMWLVMVTIMVTTHDHIPKKKADRNGGPATKTSRSTFLSTCALVLRGNLPSRYKYQKWAGVESRTAMVIMRPFRLQLVESDFSSTLWAIRSPQPSITPPTTTLVTRRYLVKGLEDRIRRPCLDIIAPDITHSRWGTTYGDVLLASTHSKWQPVCMQCYTFTQSEQVKDHHRRSSASPHPWPHPPGNQTMSCLLCFLPAYHTNLLWA